MLSPYVQYVYVHVCVCVCIVYTFLTRFSEWGGHLRTPFHMSFYLHLTDAVAAVHKNTRVEQGTREREREQIFFFPKETEEIKTKNPRPAGRRGTCVQQCGGGFVSGDDGNGFPSIDNLGQRERVSERDGV